MVPPFFCRLKPQQSSYDCYNPRRPLCVASPRQNPSDLLNFDPMVHRLTALLLGLLLTALLLVGLELFFVQNQKHQWLKGKPFDEFNIPNSVRIDESRSLELRSAVQQGPFKDWKNRLTENDHHRIQKLGTDLSQKGRLNVAFLRWGIEADLSIRSIVKAKNTKETIYDVQVNTDAFGRRITPRPKENPPIQTLLMMGDSYTFGEGVNNEESAPYILANLRPRSEVLNLGVAGGSPNQVLRELEMSPSIRLDTVKNHRVVVVYTFMDHHLERLFCRSFCMKPENEWMHLGPYYELEDGEIKYMGYFDLDRPLINWIYQIANKSALFQHFGIVLPPRFGTDHFEFFGKLMLAIKTSAQKRFPGSEFYLAFYPGASSIYSAPLSKVARDQSISVLDYSRLNHHMILDGQTIIYGDGHPTPRSHYLFAWLLNEDLPKP